VLPRRPLEVAAFLFLSAGLLGYALTYRPPRRPRPYSMFLYDQRTFYASRITLSDLQLHLLDFDSDGGVVSVNWYDSSLSSRSRSQDSGIYVTLLIDGVDVADTLSGFYSGSAGPATLTWAGRLPAGLHRFQIQVTGIPAAGAAVPLVQPGYIGTDNLSISQEPGS
jgi:hypothetical protein